MFGNWLKTSLLMAAIMALFGVIGSMMALEAIKIIAGAGDALRGRMLIFDGLYGENRVMKIARRDDCAVCGSGHSRLG